MNLTRQTADLTQTDSTQKRIFIIANPKAGSMDVERFKDDLARIFSESEHAFEIYFTQPDEKIAATIAHAIQEGWNVIAAAGGDGTVSTVADGLRDTEVPLGILPMGTGNVLAQELNIPLKLGQAVELMIGENRHRPVDAMEINGRFYLLYAGVGITSAMMSGASSESKRHFRIFAYLWSGLRKLSGWQPFHFRLEIDGRQLSSSAIEVGVANARTAGGKPFNWGKEVSVDNNQLTVCIVRSKSIWDYIGTIFDLLLGRTRQSRHIHCFSAHHHIKIDALAAISVEADGELIGKTPVEIRVVPQAVTMIVPVETDQPTSSGQAPSPDRID